MIIVNLTGFILEIYESYGALAGDPNRPITIIPEGEVTYEAYADSAAQSTITYEKYNDVIDVIDLRIGRVVGLPEPAEDTIYVVTPTAATIITVDGLGRTDIYTPYLGKIDARRQTMMCTRLARMVGLR